MATVFEDRFGISMPEWKVLAIIAEKPGLSAVAVARLAQMDTVAVSRAVTKLMDRELIARELDSEDRRRSILNLSATGCDLYAEIAPLATELEASLLEGFSAEEQQVFEKAIKALYTKSKVFTDAFTAPPRRTAGHGHAANGHSAADRYRPRQPAPLIGHRLSGTTTTSAQ
ncbi:MAG: MarR family transcriptional regulator [Gammaproteobacteria bacterium]|nr:MarR family transcriptional regulator [Gammaproteobacteria bacterium]